MAAANTSTQRDVLGLDLMAIINDQAKKGTLVGKVAIEEYSLEDAIADDNSKAIKNNPPQEVLPLAGGKTAVEILATNTDEINLSLDSINPANDKYLKDMKFVWRRKESDNKMYIYNNIKNVFTSETRGERYKYIPPQLVESITGQAITDIQFNGTIFNYVFSVKNKTMFIIDNHMSVNEGMLFVDGEMYKYKHTESDVMKIISFIQTLDKSKLL